MKKILIVVLILLNLVVLLGQLWPEGVPPFATTVNVVFLIGSLIYFLTDLIQSRSKE
jgi:hypothetical protein